MNLLIWTLGLTTEDLVQDSSKPEQRIPKHGPSQHLLEVLMDDSKEPVGAVTNSLHLHYCFAVNTRSEVEEWERHLRENGITIPGVKNWERGGYSGKTSLSGYSRLDLTRRVCESYADQWF